MPTHERVRQLIQYVESGRTEDALQEFYADDVTMAESLAPPTIGQAANLRREQEFLAHVKIVHEYRAVSFLVDGIRSRGTSTSTQRFERGWSTALIDAVTARILEQISGTTAA